MPDVQASIADKGKIFPSSPRPDWLEGPSQILYNDHRRCLLWGT